MKLDYKASGVDIEKGDELVEWLKTLQTPKDPHRDKLVSGIGGFAALFRADFKKYKKPLLVSSTDGVGTKVKLAVECGVYEYLGQDLVAMCVNDLVCCGADPLFFLDYYATGKLQLEHAKKFLQGVKSACNQSHCALIGGETAEMPGVYAANDFDCAGFVVGVVDEEEMFGAHRVNIGDVVVGIESSGFHSNGYSLVRKLFANEIEKRKNELLKPTHLYVDFVSKLKSSVRVHAAAHITGGGIHNLPRVIPKNMNVKLDAWRLPPLFLEARKKAQIDFAELTQTFNCGFGFAVVIDEKNSKKVIEVAKECGFSSQVWGRIVEGSNEVELDFAKMEEVNP